MPHRRQQTSVRRHRPLPRRHSFAKRRIARGEILCAVIEADVCAINLDPPRRHPPARPAPLVEHNDCASCACQSSGAGKPCHAAADDENFRQRSECSSIPRQRASSAEVSLITAQGAERGGQASASTSRDPPAPSAQRARGSHPPAASSVCAERRVNLWLFSVWMLSPPTSRSSAADGEGEIALRFEMHLDPGKSIVPARHVPQILDRNVTVQFSVDPAGEVEVELRRDARPHHHRQRSVRPRP